jgi:UDP:flavonoid glycosyltransferase YjiC (YdhE family)
MNSSLHSKKLHHHIVVVISSHGYGHVVMTAPVINRLQQLHPHIRITLSTRIPRTFLDSKFNGPFDHLPHSSDFGMVMNNAFECDLPASLRAYHDLHDQWQTNIATEMERLRNIGADIVISNIAYLPLIAAKQLGIPAIAMSCINWADIFKHFFPDEIEIHQQIVTAYQSADCFIRTEPAMPMSDFTTHIVAPVVAGGENRRQQLLTTLQLPAETRLVLVSMGGISTEIDASKWPSLNHIHYLVANNINNCGRSDITLVNDLNISYNDLLCSSDLLLTKPGYGSFTEAAFNGVPVLYVRRDEWPEQPFMTEWLHKQIHCTAITPDEFREGKFTQQLQHLLQTNRTTTLFKTGIDEAVGLIAAHIKPTTIG